MTEKKTFKINTIDLGYGLNYEDDFREWRLYGVQTIFEDGVNAFPTEEWSMEVTFTKKQKPLEVGQWVRVHDCGEAILAKILHIRGDFLWVSDDPDGVVDGNPSEGWIEHIANVKIPD